jgi:hypothetical protein
MRVTVVLVLVALACREPVGSIQLLDPDDGVRPRHTGEIARMILRSLPPPSPGATTPQTAEERVRAGRESDDGFWEESRKPTRGTGLQETLTPKAGDRAADHQYLLQFWLTIFQHDFFAEKFPSLRASLDSYLARMPLESFPPPSGPAGGG